MSYDVEVYGEAFNYTYNMRQFFIDFDVYPPSWNGKDRAEVGASIRAGLKKMGEHALEDLEADYNADNGWGDIYTAMRFLHKVATACEKKLSETVEVY